MEWWEELGGYFTFLPQAPALAHDMMRQGLPGATGAVPAYFMGAGPTPIEVYPAPLAPVGSEGAF